MESLEPYTMINKGLRIFFFIASLLIMTDLVLAEIGFIISGKETLNRNCITPKDGMVLTKNTNFCKGSYDLPKGITIVAPNISLNCNNASLRGSQGSVMGINLRNGTRIFIENCNIEKYTIGIFADDDVSDSIFKYNTFSAGQEGIRVGEEDSNGNPITIVNNTFYQNVFISMSIAGIHAGNCSSSVFDRNTFSGGGYFGGIYMRGCKGNIIKSNTIASNGIALHLTSFGGVYSEENVISNNTLKNNVYGIYIPAYGVTGNNQIYHNNFIGNSYQSWDIGYNYWNETLVGNFWNDFVNSGLCNDTNANGICDNPYHVPGGNNVDYLPSKNQFQTP